MDEEGCGCTGTRGYRYIPRSEKPVRNDLTRPSYSRGTKIVPVTDHIPNKQEFNRKLNFRKAHKVDLIHNEVTGYYGDKEYHQTVARDKRKRILFYFKTRLCLKCKPHQVMAVTVSDPNGGSFAITQERCSNCNDDMILYSDSRPPILERV